MAETDFSFNIKDEEHTKKLGEVLARVLPSFSRRVKRAACVFLEGDLGAGKTTLSRGFIRALGYEGLVKSPTYTLVEPYQIKDLNIFHFDFTYKPIQYLSRKQECLALAISTNCLKFINCLYTVRCKIYSSLLLLCKAVVFVV